MSETSQGSNLTRTFYEEVGWTRNGDRLVDQQLFGTRQDGPIRMELYALRERRIREALRVSAAGRAERTLELLECGCGGSPARFLADLCSRFTAADFSMRGLREARATIGATRVPQRLLAADLCSLPLADASFDAVYSAHALYHIPTAAAQGAAFDELLRVLRPGGVAVFVLANPHPLLFPLRAARRLLAGIPGVRAALDAVRRRPPLPFLPLGLRWMRRRLARWGDVTVFCHALPSTWFHQNVSERAGPGRVLWKVVRWLETRHPRAAARLGNYVTIVVRKRA